MHKYTMQSVNEETIVEIANPEDGWNADAVRINGETVPGARVLDAILNGESEESVIRKAVRAAIYRFEPCWSLVVTSKAPRPGDRVLHTADFAMPGGLRIVAVHFVQRRENMRPRPLMVGIMARLELEPTRAILAACLKLMKGRGYLPTAMVDRRLFFSRAESRDQVWDDFVGANKVHNNAHLMVRVGVLMKRPGSVSRKYTTPRNQFPDSHNDGTIMITSEATHPEPGTAQCNRKGKRLCYKGMVRPPLMVDGVVERECVTDKAQFGLATPGGGEVMEFWPVRDLPHERASLNYQAVLFGLRDPAAFIEKDNARLDKMDIREVVTQEEWRKIQAGVPPALILRSYAPWRWLGQFRSRRQARATVFGSHLVPVGQVRLLPGTFAKFSSYKEVLDEGGKPTGERVLVWEPEIVLHRDPALPNASSMCSYRLAGVAYWAGVDSDNPDAEGIVLNPLDPHWKQAGGDFDGDAAVAFVLPDDQLKPVVPTENLRTNRANAMVKLRGVPQVEATILAMVSGFTSKLGTAVMSATRLAERNWANGDVTLTPEIAKIASQVVQAAVDGKKHAVDATRGYQLLQTLKITEAEHRPDGGYLLDWIHGVRVASGDAEKEVAWRTLVEEVGRRGENLSPVERAMIARIKILDRIYRSVGWLRGSSTVMPENIRNAAVALEYSLDEGDMAERIQIVEELARRYRDAARHLRDPDSDVRLAAQEGLRLVKIQVRLAILEGRISEATLLAYGPHRMAAELVSASTFEELGATARYLKTVLFGDNWQDGEVDVRVLTPIPSMQAEFDSLAPKEGLVKIRILTRGARTTRVELVW
jgi:hypothetical protein